MAGVDVDTRHALAPGAQLADYRIDAVIGRGAFGITYRATNAAGEAVAIKEFFPEGVLVRADSGTGVATIGDRGDAFDKMCESFREEARLLESLRHPGIIPVLDQFDANGTACFVMPLHAGLSLHQRLARSGAMDADQLVASAATLREALAFIHARNVFHRDIKPANILVDDAGGAPVLIDFGAAKQEISSGTQLQTRIGTEHYRAPEQISERGAIGPWTDIYGLSATLYHAMTGRIPIDGASRQDAVFNGRADPLESLLDDRDLVAAYGDVFLRAVMAGLNIKVAERPQSVAAWQAIFDGAVPEPAAAPHAHTPPPGSAPPRTDAHGFQAYAPEPERAPWGRWIAGLVVLAAIIAGGIWLALQSTGPAPVIDTADVSEPDAPSPQPTRNADDEAWVRALEQDTLEGYRAYLEAFPNGRHKDAAQENIDRYDNEAWARAEQRDTIAGYEDYLEGFPDGLHASQARERIQQMRAAVEAAAADAAERARQEAADWEAAARADTVAGYDTYLDKHPTGAHASEARARRDRLQASAADRAAWEQAQAINRAEAYEQYLRSFPQGAYAMQARAAIDRLRPAPGRVITDCAGCPPMVVLPSGTANLGAPDSDNAASPAEKPQRPVSFSGIFAIAQTEVTFDQWQPCVQAGSCSAVASDNGWGRGNRPVINVTWEDAQAYAGWLSQETGQSYSLPSEAQWEYAARGGESGTLAGGSVAALCAYANGAGSESGLQWGNGACADPAPDRTLPAGALAANSFGVRDMIGNVAEWTLDCNTLNLRDAPSDGGADMRGSCGQRAVRGGSWFSGPDDLRFTARLMQRRGDSNDFTGFRVVRRIEP